MWKYQHPDFAIFLLGELQKQQQQGSVFCDTFLQTDGVCVPAHSCVLAALSPVFSRILSSSPAPHAGQNRLLNLEAVGSRNLLKLVGFLYTGEMEISSQSEHEEVMAAALRLGLRNLLEKKRVLVERVVGDVERRWKETGVQTEDESGILSETQSSTETPVQSCGLLESDLPPLSLFDEASSARDFHLTSNVTVPPLADMTEASSLQKTNKRWKMAKRDGQLNRLPQNQKSEQNQTKLLNVDETDCNQTGTEESSRNVSGKDFQKLLDTDNGQKNFTTEQKEAKLDKFKIKIKLRRMRGASWESNLLVSVQGETDKKLEEGKESGFQTQSCPSGVLPGQSLGTLTPPTDLPISPSTSSTNASSDKYLHTPHHISSPLDFPTLSSNPPQTDDSDEQIAMLLEDMFMMGLNILPLMPLERNLDEHEQLPSLQEQKDDQRTTEVSTQMELQMRESDVKKTTSPARSPGQRDEEHSGFESPSKSNTVELQESPGEDHLNNITNLPTLLGHSPPSLVEDLFLTPKASAVAGYPSPTTHVLASILNDKPDFRLLQCLSPIESEKGDGDVPTQDSEAKSSHSRDPETPNLPSWLSESPIKLDFPLSSMIDFSCPRLECDLNACQNRSRPDPAEKQELKTSFSHNDLISGSSSNTLQPDVCDDREQPKLRRKRRRRLTIRKTKVDRKKKSQNVEKEDQDQPKIAKCDVPASNARRVGNKNRRGVKRRRASSSPHGRKKFLTESKQQHEHTNVLPELQVTGVKRRCGRPAKSTKTQTNNEKTLPTSGQNDCEAKNLNTEREIEQAIQEPKTQQEKDSTGMEEADVNNNSVQKTRNPRLKVSDKVKGAHILDKIFHQTRPSRALRSSVTIDQLQTSSLRDSSFRLQKFSGEKSQNENSKLMMTGSEQIHKEALAEKNVETSTRINIMEDSDHQTSVSLTCDNVKCPVKGGDIITGNNSSRTTTVLQNSDLQNEIAQDNQLEDIMMPVGDTLSPTKTVMERIEVIYFENSELLENSEALVASFEETDSEKDIQPAHVVNTQDMSWVKDSLESIEKEEELGMKKEAEMFEETVEADETEVMTLLVSDDVCWKTTSDDKGGCNMEVDQYDADMINDHPLEEEELSEEHSANVDIADDPSNGALTHRNAQEIICRDAPEASNFHSSNACSEDASMVLSDPESKEDCQVDEDDIEVDVLEDSVDSPLGLLAAREVVTVSIDGLMVDQEDELEATEEEEEVDVTGEETE